MKIQVAIALWFGILGIVFLAGAARKSWLRNGSVRLTRDAWARMGAIFTAVGLLLYWFHTLGS